METAIILAAAALTFIVRRECQLVTMAEQAAQRQRIDLENRKLWAFRTNQTTDWKD